MRFTQEHETRTIVQGKEYHAQSAPEGLCNGCAFYNSPMLPHCCESVAMAAATPCMPHQRADRSPIIWVPA